MISSPLLPLCCILVFGLIAEVRAFRVSRNLQLISRLNHKSVKVFNLLNDKDARDRFNNKVKTMFTTVISNVTNDLKNIRSNRDSVIIIQLVTAFFCIFGMPLFIAYCVQIGGMISLLTGLYFIIKGMWDLNENLTLFIKPIRNNVLVATGLLGTFLTQVLILIGILIRFV